MSRIGKTLKTVAAGIVILAVTGCTSLYRNHGYVPPEDDLSAITVGVDTRDSVAESIGTPGAAGVLNDSGYYYVQSRMRHFAYRRPEVTDREVVAISFDKRGVVSNVERFTLEDGRVVPLTRRVTSSNVTNKGFLRQLLGNIGRVRASDFAG
ncbi:SmpA / OmlA family protein [Thalassovita gelatinovora]|uniref:SmpA / OmlA family protein n=1 Tax=Thalassovita gelatinovora TaxID=53501 RepID=A0A0P1G2T5_THAGE|nr:outer membrane protein assembly factor BamE [Thalassovita gelatinovora]QIZ79637.1 outer membrane protein assembly factor BamE [Thalassovita gelatinovora]CUH66585.1 SmpA / OmlA family protein [Thalassovita gelatinovora]SEQ38406.1 Beta-barrel assembly machine subunit BamE [Thalassovita gelatinovora]